MEQFRRTVVIPDSELRLVDLWRSIVRRKALVLAIVFVSIGAGLAFLLVTKPVYQARAIVLIGQVAGIGPIEPIERLIVRLESKYGRRIADGINRERPFLEAALPVRSLPSGVQLVVEAYAPDEAAALLSSIVIDVRESHEPLFDHNRRALSDRLAGIAAQRRALTEQYDDASTILARLKDKDPVQASLIFLDRGRIAQQIIEVEAERPQIAQKLGPPQTHPTQLINDIIAPAVPSFPERISVLALAATVGVLAGVLLAIIIEYAGASPRHS